MHRAIEERGATAVSRASCGRARRGRGWFIVDSRV
jgi:hypothetical protein